jgi:hypothetical protein
MALLVAVEAELFLLEVAEQQMAVHRELQVLAVL